MALPPLNLPNRITLARILACPVLAVLLFSSRASLLLLAFVLFLAAALSDLWDGYLARKHGWVTDAGKLLDPLADKLLLVATFVPFYIVSQRPEAATDVPWWGPLPLWVVLVIFGRELFVTGFRAWAASRGAILSAGKSGKIKAFVQNIFSGSLILWYGLLSLAGDRGWDQQAAWEGWSLFHGAVTALALAVALFLTVWSMGVYLWQNRGLMRGGSGG